MVLIGDRGGDTAISCSWITKMAHHLYCLLSLSLAPAPALLIHHQDSPPLLPCLAPDLAAAWTLATRQDHQSVAHPQASIMLSRCYAIKVANLQRLQWNRPTDFHSVLSPINQTKPPPHASTIYRPILVNQQNVLRLASSSLNDWSTSFSSCPALGRRSQHLSPTERPPPMSKRHLGKKEGKKRERERKGK